MLDTHPFVYTGSCTCGEAHISCSQTDTGQQVTFHQQIELVDKI
jgi:hypothetical protein